MSTVPVTETDLLHAHYRHLLDSERSARSLERQLWDSERVAFQRRIAVLEAEVDRLKTRASERDDHDADIGKEELEALVKEARRVVPRPRVRGRSPAIGRGPGRRDEDDDVFQEEVVELRLKKTSNFGVEFGRARGGW